MSTWAAVVAKAARAAEAKAGATAPATRGAAAAGAGARPALTRAALAPKGEAEADTEAEAEAGARASTRASSSSEGGFEVLSVTRSQAEEPKEHEKEHDAEEGETVAEEAPSKEGKDAEGTSACAEEREVAADEQASAEGRKQLELSSLLVFEEGQGKTEEGGAAPGQEAGAKWGSSTEGAQPEWWQWGWSPVMAWPVLAEPYLASEEEVLLSNTFIDVGRPRQPPTRRATSAPPAVGHGGAGASPSSSSSSPSSSPSKAAAGAPSAAAGGLEAPAAGASDDLATRRLDADAAAVADPASSAGLRVVCPPRLGAGRPVSYCLTPRTAKANRCWREAEQEHQQQLHQQGYLQHQQVWLADANAASAAAAAGVAVPVGFLVPACVPLSWATGGTCLSPENGSTGVGTDEGAAREAWEEEDDDESSGFSTIDDQISNDLFLPEAGDALAPVKRPKPPPVYSPDAPLPSVGSEGHGEGTCKRCCFFPKGRCLGGYDCAFCHFAHEKPPHTKKKKHKHSTFSQYYQRALEATTAKAAGASKFSQQQQPQQAHQPPESQAAAVA